MQQNRMLEGCVGAALFMAGGIMVYGLADLIEVMDMHTAQYEVQPQSPVSAAFRVEHCKSCGKTLFKPADREPLVIGYLCSRECELENAAHYGKDDYE